MRSMISRSEARSDSVTRSNSLLLLIRIERPKRSANRWPASRAVWMAKLSKPVPLSAKQIDYWSMRIYQIAASVRSPRVSKGYVALPNGRASDSVVRAFVVWLLLCAIDRFGSCGIQSLCWVAEKLARCAGTFLFSRSILIAAMPARYTVLVE